MTSYPRWNFDAFAAATASLRAAGYEVTSPHEADLANGFDPDAPVECFTAADYQAAMRADIGHVLAADGVALLDGWVDSRGARVEQTVAAAIGTPAYLVSSWLTFAAPLPPYTPTERPTP